MISTSSHSNCKTSVYRTVAISGNKGKDADYVGESFSALAPKKGFWKVWHDNIGKIPEEDNNKYYIEEYYKQVLSKLDPKATYEKLDYSILLCYEDVDKFCHRHVVAAWFELFLGVNVAEVKVNEFYVEESSKPENIKSILEDVIKSNLDMKGFNSIQALYLFEKGNELDEVARRLEEKGDSRCLDCMQEAAYLRSNADACEEVYNKSKKNPKVKKV